MIVISGKTLLKITSAALTVLLLFFAYRYIVSLVADESFRTASILSPFALLASVVFFVVYYGLHSIHWLWSVRIVEPGAPERQSLAFFASQPYKYLPTSLFTFSFRGVYSRHLGVSMKRSSIAQLFENASMLTANFMLFSLLYVAMIDKVYGLFAFLVILTLAKLLYNRRFKVNIKGRSFSVNSSYVIKLLTISMLAWLFCGFSFVALNIALGIQVLDPFILLAANTIAFSLSILAVFAPGGIGVREAVYGFFSVIAAAIIYWRILVFVLDFILGVAAIYIIKKGKLKKTTLCLGRK